jgi:hypothetical protein
MKYLILQSVFVSFDKLIVQAGVQTLLRLETSGPFLRFNSREEGLKVKGDSVDKVVKESSVIIIIPITKLKTCYINLQILSSKIHFQFVFTATRRCVNSITTSWSSVQG